MFFLLQASTHPTSDKESGLLPTPEHFDYNSARHPELWERDKKKYAEKGINLHCNLRQQARLGMLPTPKTQDMRGNVFVDRGRYNLMDAVAEMLPTPTTRDWKGGLSQASLNGTKKFKSGESLPDTIKRTTGVGGCSQLNPRFVAEMMGFPPNWTESPFQSGETNPSKDTGMQ
jgi:hypothetical protein